MNTVSENLEGCPCGVMVKASSYSSHAIRFTFGQRYEPTYPTSYGLNSTTTVLFGEWLWN